MSADFKGCSDDETVNRVICWNEKTEAVMMNKKKKERSEKRSRDRYCCRRRDSPFCSESKELSACRLNCAAPAAALFPHRECDTNVIIRHVRQGSSSLCVRREGEREGECRSKSETWEPSHEPNARSTEFIYRTWHQSDGPDGDTAFAVNLTLSSFNRILSWLNVVFRRKEFVQHAILSSFWYAVSLVTQSV